MNKIALNCQNHHNRMIIIMKNCITCLRMTSTLLKNVGAATNVREQNNVSLLLLINKRVVDKLVFLIISYLPLRTEYGVLEGHIHMEHRHFSNYKKVHLLRLHQGKDIQNKNALCHQFCHQDRQINPD